jgi:hypothetical protein
VTTAQRRRQALEALGAKGPGRWLVRNLDLPGSSIGWGVTFTSLERDGFVRSVYQHDESAGSPKLWWLTDKAARFLKEPAS